MVVPEMFLLIALDLVFKRERGVTPRCLGRRAKGKVVLLAAAIGLCWLVQYRERTKLLETWEWKFSAFAPQPKHPRLIGSRDCCGTRF